MKFWNRFGIGMIAVLAVLEMSSCKVVSEPGHLEAAGAGSTAKADVGKGDAGKGDSGGAKDVSQKLRLKCVVSTRDESVPDINKAAPGRCMEGALRGGGVIQLNHRVGISSGDQESGTRLYLAFPEELGDRRIVDGSFEHESRSSTGAVERDPSVALISHNPDQRIFFISLDDLKGRRKEGLRPTDLQVLTLSLVLDDNSKVQLEVRFNLTAELPAVESMRIVSTPSAFTLKRNYRPILLHELALIRKSGIVFLKEKYTNPSAEPLTLWLSPHATDVKLQVQIGVRLVDADRDPVRHVHVDEYGLESDLNQVSSAPLKISRVRVARESSRTSEEFLLNRQVPIFLAPSENVDVEWIADLASPEPTCFDGLPTSRRMFRCYLNPSENPVWQATDSCPWSTQGIYNNSLAQNPPWQTFAGEWEVSGYQIEGSITELAQVTEAGEEQFDPSERRSRAIHFVQPKVAPLSGLTPYSCQGTF